MPLGNGKGRNGDSFGLLFKIFAISFIVLAIYLQWSNSTSTNPGQALKKAIALLDQRNLTDVESLLEIARENPYLVPWAELYNGKYFEAKGDVDSAAIHYLAVPQDSAASLESRLRLVSIKEFLNDNTLQKLPFKDTAEEIDKLESDLRRFNREDLRCQALLTKARYAEQNKTLEAAMGIYFTVRSECKDRESTTAARERVYALRDQNPSFSIDQDPTAVADEVKLLLRENEPLLASKAIERAKDLTAPQSATHTKLMQIDVDVLLAMNRKLEAEQTLAEVSTTTELGTADIALHRLIKKYWNDNNQHQALELVGRFRERFPTSPLTDDVQYMEARLLEELGQVEDAHRSYEALAKSSANPAIQLQTLRRTAWLYFADGEYQEATKHFSKAEELAAATLRKLANTPRTQDYRAAEEEFLHSKFWQAASLLKTPPTSPANRENTEKQAVKPLTELATNYANTYYGLMARHQLVALGLSSPKPDYKTASNSQNNNDPATIEGCTVSTSNKLRERLHQLQSASLLQLGKYEIDWELPVQSDPNQTSPIELAELKSEITRAMLYGEYAPIHESVKSALRALRNLPSNPQARVCTSFVIRLAYPTPNFVEFKDIAEKQTLDASLLLAIAHTESNFDAGARSAKGALGLLQVMPATAKLEGIKVSDAELENTLLDPSINLNFGAKHLAHLLRDYNGELAYAIAAYNSGSAATNRWRSRNPDIDVVAWIELISYPETKDYVKRVLLAKDIYTERTLNFGSAKS